MRIRKRTPARAASPGPPPLPPPPPLPLQRPTEKPRDEAAEEEEEEKRAVLAAGVREGDDRVRPAAAAAGSGNSSATDDVPRPEPQEQDAARCSRNDGKRWRCKKAAVPGYLFCDRHIAWSTRKRKPRASSKPKVHGSGVLEPTAIAQEFAEDHGPTQRDAGFLGGF